MVFFAEKKKVTSVRSWSKAQNCKHLFRDVSYPKGMGEPSNEGQLIFLVPTDPCSIITGFANS